MNSNFLPRLLDESRTRLAAEGLNLWGTASVRDFDACQARERRITARVPGGRSVVVVASGGRSFWERMVGTGHSYLVPAPGFHPIDERTRELVESERDRLAARGHRAELLYPFERSPIDFVALGELAGLGVRSPVVPLLLHPEYGPWISFRAALVLEEPLPVSGPLDEFEPCSECAAPCLCACPAEAVARAGEKNDAHCAEHRSAGGCQHGCDVRGACVYGRAHRYGKEERAFRNAYVRYELERWYGLGRWRFVPPFLRRR